MDQSKKTKKHPGGRPPKFKSVKEIQVAIDNYFFNCDNRKIEQLDKLGRIVEVKVKAPYTMSGLANSLNISRETLCDYRKNKGDEFSEAITCARAKVQEDIENRLMETRNEKGAIFNLINNFGWKQKTETDLTSKGDKIEGNTIVFSSFKNASESK